MVNTGNRKIIKTYFLVLKDLAISYLQSLSLNIASLLLRLCITFCLVQYKSLLTSFSSFSSLQVCVLVTQLCPTLWDLINYSLPGSSVHGILQAKMLERVSHSFLQGSNLGLLHCRQILYHLSHEGALQITFAISARVLFLKIFKLCRKNILL